MNNVGEMTHDGAVTAIKNIVLAGYYVPMERTDFQYLYNKALIKVCKGITTNRDDVNWQILQALYSTQFTSEQKLNEQVRQEVVEEIICRIQNSLVNLDANKINFKRNIFKCLSNDNRFSAFVPVVW